MLLRRAILLLGLGLGVAPRATAQSSAAALSAPDLRFADPFSQLGPGLLRELRDGRVIVADPRERLLLLVDLGRGTSTALSAEGRGPREYLMPQRLLGIGGDSTFVFDQQNQRYLLLGPNGVALGTIRPEVEGGVSGGGMQLLIPARASDSAGHLYIESVPFAMRDGRMVRSDSAAILRLDLRRSRADTMGFVRVLPLSTTQSNGRTTVSIGGGNPLTPRDEWTVFSDGRLAIVRHDPYRVDFVEPNGSRRSSAPLPFAKERLSDADKAAEELRRARAQAALQARIVELPNGGVVQPGNPADLPPLRDWPEWRPPFRSGFQSVVARHKGELWIQRLEAAGARGVLYDVVDARGALLRQVRLDPGVLLVGFGQQAIYTARADSEGLLYLQRHPG